MGPSRSEFGRTVTVVPPPPRPVHWFGRWVAESVTESSEVLNIGAGRNLSGALRPVRRRAPHLVGVDPDATIWSNDGLDERHQASLEEFAAEHPGRFDVAFSVFVLEHVADPEAFAAACGQVLRPGGVLFGMTVHKYQYFGLATWAATRMHVADRLLKRLKGPEVMERYHFPTEYRMNSPRQVSRQLRAAGFRSAEFRMYDKANMYAWYLPDRLKPFSQAWSRTAYRLEAPWMMGHMCFRAER